MIPKIKMLTGRLSEGDVYITPKGRTWLYSGTKPGDWGSPKFWKRL